MWIPRGPELSLCGLNPCLVQQRYSRTWQDVPAYPWILLIFSLLYLFQGQTLANYCRLLTLFMSIVSLYLVPSAKRC